MNTSRINLEEVVNAVERDHGIGFCVYCGDETDGVEPDARRYPCPSCGKRGVFGAEELLMMMEE